MASAKNLIPALIRALVPSWSFFSQIGDTPLLRLRLVDARGEAKSWQVHPSFRGGDLIERKPLDLFHNPGGNGRLAERALVTRAVEELLRDGEEAFFASNTYQLLKELATSGLPVEYPRLQFQIWIEGRDGSTDEVFLSDVIELAPDNVGTQ